MMINIKIYSKSIKGIRKESNQDLVFWDKNRFQQILLGIADGVGSYKESRSLTQIVAKVLKVAFQTENFEHFHVSDLQKWVQKIINEQIYHQAIKIFSKVATTLTFVIICSKIAYFFHVGNTRLYQFNRRTNQLFKLTEDHNFVSGNDDTFSWMKGKKFLKNSVSNFHKCYVDFHPFMLKTGYLFLTTDGLHDFVDYKEIQNVLQYSHYQEKEKIEFLFKKALLTGSLDDITCLLAKIEVYGR